MTQQTSPESGRGADKLLSGTVNPSRSFAAAMRVLGQVVESDFTFRTPDRSTYQKWLLEQYLKELPGHMGKAARQLPALLKDEARLSSQAAKLHADADGLAQGISSKLGEDFFLARKHYWTWLYEQARDQWLVLDPVVTVAPETVFFEALSTDESTYVRVSLPMTAIDISGSVKLGCTNIDYSTDLDRVLARTRSYRPLNIEVSESGLRMGSAELVAQEDKIDPPQSWMRAFAEVQAALGLASLTLDISPGFLADIIATLRARRTQHGPRALIFHLDPGKPIRAELQPWGVTITDRRQTWRGAEARTIKIWGRRRLELLAPLLPEATSATVSLISDGLPSSWTVSNGEVQTTLVLSGWTSREWAGRASFLGASPMGEDHADVVEMKLRAAGSATLAELAAATGLDALDTQRALGALTRLGRATLDLTTGKYLARAFPFAPGATSEDPLSLAERKARDFVAGGRVTTQVAELDGGGLEVKGSFWQDSRSVASVVLDADRRVRACSCTCSDFRFHGLRNGPCAHLIATLGAV